MVESASTLAAGSVGSVETQCLDLPKPVRLGYRVIPVNPRAREEAAIHAGALWCQFGVAHGIVTAVFIGYQQLENHVLNPVVMTDVPRMGMLGKDGVIRPYTPP